MKRVNKGEKLMKIGKNLKNKEKVATWGKQAASIFSRMGHFGGRFLWFLLSSLNFRPFRKLG